MNTKLIKNVLKDRIKTAMIASVIIGAIYILMSMFVIGGENFVYTLNNLITIPLAITTTAFAYSLWSLVGRDRINRLLWGGLMIGWTFWTIAEILWVVYGYIYQEVPYPSPADYFWLTGYIPLGLGLYYRVQAFGVKLGMSQKITLWSILIATIAITTIFVIVPTAQSSDLSNLLLSALNIIYPLVDLLLLILIIRLFFVYTKGNFGTGWYFLAAGFLVHSISNLVFSYASYWGLYYPDLKVNLISTLAIDVPYNLSYLLSG